MHVTPTIVERLNKEKRQNSKAVSMASLNGDDDGCNGNDGGNQQKQRTHSRNSNNNNNNNEESSGGSAAKTPITTTATKDPEELKIKRQTLEQRKQELERLLSEKNWLLQQLQKQEAHMLNGNNNNDFLTLNELLAGLVQQYKQEQTLQSGAAGGSGGGDTGILRRKNASASKENQMNNNNSQNNNNNNNRQSEISNRSSEYDNYPTAAGGSCLDADINSLLSGGSGGALGAVGALKSSLKKRTTPTPTGNLNYIQVQHAQRPQPQYQHQQQQQQHQQQYYQYVAQQQQQQLQQYPHYHPQQQQAQAQRAFASRPLPQPSDSISLYSVNSANVATLRQQHVAPQQQPIVVQCDKYYLSPTHQSYSDGGFIKSSQNIKKYVSPMASPNNAQLQQLQAAHHSAHLAHLRQLDAISLAPSYMSVDGGAGCGADIQPQQMRWRSTSNLPPPAVPRMSPTAQAPPPPPSVHSHSSEMLAHFYTTLTSPLDDISIESLLAEGNQQVTTSTQAKKSKPKQWLESSLDGPVMRETLSITSAQMTRLPTKHVHHLHGNSAARSKLSSHSMSSGRHYSMSSTHKTAHGVQKLLLDDEGRRYAKLSQSTSQLNAMENAGGGGCSVVAVNNSNISATYALDSSGALEIPSFKYLPPKANALGAATAQLTPPPRPPPPPSLAATAALAEKPAAPPPPLQPLVLAAVNPNTAASSALSPEIRIESPKNMTVVQQATFQPYKEVTKPFEMSDFYKYSTKYRQKEAGTPVATAASHHSNNIDTAAN